MTLRQRIRLRRAAAPRSVEELRGLIGELTLERQQLRAAHADPEALERNRLELGTAQRELTYALIAQHVAHAA